MPKFAVSPHHTGRSQSQLLASLKYYCMELTTFWKQPKDCGGSTEELLFVLMYSIKTTLNDPV